MEANKVQDDFLYFRIKEKHHNSNWGAYLSFAVVPQLQRAEKQTQIQHLLNNQHQNNNVKPIIIRVIYILFLSNCSWGELI